MRHFTSLGALAKLGHEVRLMPPAYVKPYEKRGKTDANDAEAICEAVARPTMAFVPMKSQEQQAALALHRTRDLLVKQRTQLVNMIRGLLAEFGIEIVCGLHHAIELAVRIPVGYWLDHWKRTSRGWRFDPRRLKQLFIHTFPLMGMEKSLLGLKSSFRPKEGFNFS